MIGAKKQIVKVQNWPFWIGLLLIFTLIHFSINLDFLGLSWDNMIILDGDAEQYIGSTENLLRNGEFTFYKTNEHLFFSNLLDQNSFDKGIYYAFRTPGFAIIYYPIRLFFNFHNSLYIIIFLQVLFNAITKYLLCLLLFKITKNRIAFFLGVLFFMFSILASFYNNFLMTESFAIFFLVTSLYLLHSGLNSANKWIIFWSGICLTEAMLLRPFLAPLFLPFLLLIYFQFKKTDFKILVFYFLIPLLLFELFWIPRNFIKTGEFIPLSKTMEIFRYSNIAFLSHQKITQNIAVSGEWWNKNSPTFWFVSKYDNRPVLAMYPKSLFVSLNDTSKILLAKREYLLSTDQSISLSLRKLHEKKSSYLLNSINNNLKDINPYYSIKSRTEIAAKMIYQPLQKPLISIKYPYNVMTVMIESLINRFAFILGLIATITAFFRFKRNHFIYLTASIPIYLFILFTFLMGQFEYREMYIAYYFFAFFGIELVTFLIFNKKYKLLLLSFVMLFTLVSVDIINNIIF